MNTLAKQIAIGLHTESKTEKSKSAGAKREMNVTCPCCNKQHEIKWTSRTNWHGDQAGEREVFAGAWCPEAGREVGEWIPDPHTA